MFMNLNIRNRRQKILHKLSFETEVYDIYDPVYTSEEEDSDSDTSTSSEGSSLQNRSSSSNSQENRSASDRAKFQPRQFVMPVSKPAQNYTHLQKRQLSESQLNEQDLDYNSENNHSSLSSIHREIHDAPSSSQHISEKPDDAEHGGCLVEEMQDDTVMNKCKSMFQHGQNYIVLESMIEEEKQRESEKKKTTGRFKIGGSSDKKIDDSIIRILPGQTKAVKEGEIIGDILSPVRNAIQLTKIDAIVQQDIQICDQENQHVPSKQNIMTDGSSSANLSDLHDYKQPSMNQLQIVDSGSEISLEQPPILNVNITTQKIPQRKTVEVYKSKIDFYNKMGKMRKASNCSNLSSKDVSRSKSRPGSKQLSKKPSKTLISASTGALPVFMSSNLTKTPQKAQTRNQ